MLKITCIAALYPLTVLSSVASGQNTFTEVSASLSITGVQCSWGAAWGDYDGDGFLDLFTHTHIQVPLEEIYGIVTRDHLYRNENGANFAEVTEALGVKAAASDPHGAAWADVDNDGDPDLLVSHGTPKTVGSKDYNEFYRNEAGQAMVDQAVAVGLAGIGHHGRGLAWADYDRDGHLDVYYAGEDKIESGSALYRQNEDGSFTDMAATAGVVRDGEQSFSVAWHDVDLDGWPDLTVSAENAAPSIAIYHNNGNGTFSQVNDAMGLVDPGKVFSFAWGDYDNDGDPDLALQKGDDKGARLLRNDRGRFKDVTNSAGISFTFLGRGAAWGDYDNDGDLDLYLVAYSHPKNRDLLFRNNGNGSFTRAGRETGLGGLASTAKAMDITFVDFNNDGALDLFGSYGSSCTSASGAEQLAPFVLYKNSGPENNWLKIRLRGTTSNRDGLGARVSLVANAIAQHRQHTGPSHFTSQDSQPVHFGLGTATQVERVEVTWPSGRVSTLQNVGVNAQITIEEP